MEYVIVGGGAAGVSAAFALREADPDGSIRVISKDGMPYSAVFLAEYLEGEAKESDLYIKEPEAYEKAGIEIIKGEVEGFEPGKVILGDGEVEYDRLLIATGSKPFIPPIEGVSKQNIFTFQSLADAKNLRKAVEKARSAAIIGAGPIGLEVAYSLRVLGLKVRVFELFDRILPGLVEREISEMVQREFEKHGIEFHTGVRVEEFVGDSKVEGILAGEEYEADVVVLSTGVKPNIERFKGKLRTNKGILVNRRMETSLKNVYAAGDVAEAENFFGEVCVTPTWSNAVSQGRVAGLNMAGVEAFHEGSIRANIVKKSTMPVVSIGLSGDFDSVTYRTERIYRKAFFREGMLVGFQSAGSWSDVSLSGVLQFLIRKKLIIKNKEETVKRTQSLKNLAGLYFNK
jgi:NADPH-dependent 2,4-dienoyl-CoA reductase/sulfur reductase-like enzyme